jgi:exopolysaccharide biosynthesis polyprenyl glycosylphosphotransferase
MDASRLSAVAGEHTVELPIVRLNGQPDAAMVDQPRNGVVNGARADGPRATGATTAVIPYAGSRTSRHTRWLRSWMLTAPVDLAAMLAPLLFSRGYWRAIVSAALLTVVFFAVGGLYRTRRHISLLDELPSLFGRLLAAAAVIAVIAAMRHDSVGYGADFMRGVALAAGLVIVGRAVTAKITLIARRRRWVEQNTLVIGGGPIGVELARLLRRYPQYGLRFVGHVDAEARHGAPTVPLVGTLEKLPETITMVECDVLVIADPDCSESALMELLHHPVCVARDLWMVQRLWGSRTHGSSADHVGAIPVVQVGDTTLSGPRWAIKRFSDIVFASVALLVLSPVFLLCMILTFLDGGPGIFFHQERIGHYGRPIRVIKFRTMRPRDEQESQTNWSIATDQRVSPIGRFMRRLSLDELPQLWNILRGDMTVVGPRPERPYFVEKFSAEYPDYAMRHRAPVGLTGLAQVSGLRGDTPISDRARFDNYYIENWSLWLDFKVVLRTVTEVFRGGGR